jgi:hypothetical protein
MTLSEPDEYSCLQICLSSRPQIPLASERAPVWWLLGDGIDSLEMALNGESCLTQGHSPSWQPVTGYCGVCTPGWPSIHTLGQCWKAKQLPWDELGDSLNNSSTSPTAPILCLLQILPPVSVLGNLSWNTVLWVGEDSLGCPHQE